MAGNDINNDATAPSDQNPLDNYVSETAVAAASNAIKRKNRGNIRKSDSKA